MLNSNFNLRTFLAESKAPKEQIQEATLTEATVMEYIRERMTEMNNEVRSCMKEYLQRCNEIDPGHEDAHAQLMGALEDFYNKLKAHFEADAMEDPMPGDEEPPVVLPSDAPSRELDGSPMIEGEEEDEAFGGEEDELEERAYFDPYDELEERTYFDPYDELEESENEDMVDEDHSADPTDKYVVRPCKNKDEPWAVWEGETRVKGFATKEEAQEFADTKNKEQGLNENLIASDIEDILDDVYKLERGKIDVEGILEKYAKLKNEPELENFFSDLEIAAKQTDKGEANKYISSAAGEIEELHTNLNKNPEEVANEGFLDRLKKKPAQSSTASADVLTADKIQARIDKEAKTGTIGDILDDAVVQKTIDLRNATSEQIKIFVSVAREADHGGDTITGDAAMKYLRELPNYKSIEEAGMLEGMSKEEAEAWKKFQKDNHVTPKTILVAKKDFEKEWDKRTDEGKEIKEGEEVNEAIDPETVDLLMGLAKSAVTMGTVPAALAVLYKFKDHPKIAKVVTAFEKHLDK